MKEIKLIKIDGRITNLKITDSKIYLLKNVESQATATVMLGTLTASSSLITNAPIMMLASNGIKAKTFTCNVGDYRLAGQFTAIKFAENDALILIVSEKQQEGRHLVYAVLDPKSGLLYMIYEMGISLKQLYKGSILNGIFIYLFIVIFMFIIIFWGQSNFTNSDYIDHAIRIIIGSAVVTVIFVIGYINIGNSLIMLSKISEQIFYKLGFENIDNQNFHRKSIIDSSGLHRSVMKYRENLKGKDPYPEDYFDKNPIKGK